MKYFRRKDYIYSVLRKYMYVSIALYNERWCKNVVVGKYYFADICTFF